MASTERTRSRRRGCQFADLGENVTQFREAEPGTDDDAVAALMSEYLAWAERRLREEYGLEQSPADPGSAREMLQKFRRPDAMLLVAERSGNPAGVGVVWHLGGEVAEVKRMYVAPDARGLHLGSGILDRLVDEARTKGARLLRLDSPRFMTDAHLLYRSRGFAERDPYEGSEVPQPIQHFWYFFELDLRRG